MARTQIFGDVSGGIGGALQWLARPLDGPAALLLALVLACALLGLAFRRSYGPER